MILRSEHVLRFLVLVVAPVSSGCDNVSDEEQPELSAEGEVDVYFSSNRSGNYELYRLQDRQLMMLTDDSDYDSWWPRQSPDGRTMLFYRSLIEDRPTTGGHNNNYENASLWSLDLQTQRVTELIPKGGNGWSGQGVVDWSPDGTQLVMAAIESSSNRCYLYITGASGQDPVRIPTQTLLPLDPSWSPDGSRIVYAAFPPDYIGLDTARLEIYTINRDGTNAVRLTNDEWRDHDPYWSPDGSSIAFETEVDPTYFGIGRWALRIVNVDDASVRVVIDDAQINTLPRWSADGTKLYFHRFVFGDDRGFFTASIDTDGANLEEITVGGNYDDTDIDWFRTFQ